MSPEDKISPPPKHVSRSTMREIEKLIDQYFPGGFTVRDEANAIVALAFRNGPIEDLHAGKPSELLEDETLSRITNEEMKTIMINASENVSKFLKLKESDPGEYYRKMMDGCLMYCKGWER